MTEESVCCITYFLVFDGGLECGVYLGGGPGEGGAAGYVGKMLEVWRVDVYCDGEWSIWCRVHCEVDSGGAKVVSWMMR